MAFRSCPREAASGVSVALLLSQTYLTGCSVTHLHNDTIPKIGGDTLWASGKEII
jgi:hypothetical protein